MGVADPEHERERLVEDLADAGRIERESTIAALGSVPRHEFVPEGRKRDAYRDRPLPIGEDQTVSAPHMVGMMTDCLDLEPGDRVLEIGTGCGYHAAVTAEVVGARDHGGDGDDGSNGDAGEEGEVYSVEYHAALAEAARERLAGLGYAVEVRVGDGHAGWPAHAPYDAAYLTCAAPEIPEAVIDQVAPGGRIVAPIGRGRQTLVAATKHSDGTLDRETVCGVRFVRMQGG